MNEPATSAAEAAAAAGVVITVTGSIFGLQFDAIMAGFTGALVATSLVREEDRPDERWSSRILRGTIQLVAAGLLAGFLAPIAEVLIANLLPGKVPAQALHVAVAGVLGMVAPVVVPILRKLAQKLGDRP